MQPKFSNGETVLVKQTSSVFEAEIGVFVLNGESYIKKLGKKELVSLNPAYKPIPLHGFDDVRCVGKGAWYTLICKNIHLIVFFYIIRIIGFFNIKSSIC